MSARKVDGNGFWEIPDNPISKAGVFPYLGAQLPRAPDPMKIYQVLRSPEELGDPETVKSFRLQPWIIAHEMLGPEDKGLTPAEQKGVHGVIGEQVWYDTKTDTLRANIRGFSGELDDQIDNGVKELSLGYFHDLDWTPGVWRGQRHDAVMRNIRGNHMASVSSGRMGPEVAVMDGLQGFDPNIFTLKKDSDMDPEMNKTLQMILDRLNKLEGSPAASADDDGAAAGKDNDGAAAGKDDDAGKPDDTENKGAGKDDEGAAGKDDDSGSGDITPEKLAETLKTICERLDRLEAAKAAAATDDDDGTAGKDDDSGASEKAKGMDAALIQQKIMRDIAGRERLAAQLIPHVGTFDHSVMTKADVARYGVKKLGLSCAKGQESAALSGYLAGVGKAPVQAFAMDSSGFSAAPRGQSKALKNYLEGGK